MRTLRVGGCEEVGRRAGGGRLGPGGRARRAGYTCTHTQTRVRARSHRRTPGPAPAAPGHWLARSREKQGGPGVPRMQMKGGINHSSPVNGGLQAGSFSQQALKSVRPPPGPLPSLASQLPVSFLEASYSPSTLFEVAGLKINPALISSLQGHPRPF